MRFKGLDLNLLQALDVLLEERHVSRAAERLNVSQPAMSGVLTRLRQYFNDPLLTQHGKRMVPTPHALSLGPRLKSLLGDIDSLVAQLSHFDPATSERVFKVIASDYFVVLAMPHIARLISEKAPGISVDFANPSERSVEQFQQGEIDLLITPEYMTRHDQAVEHLYDEEQVVLGCGSNPVLADGMITEDDFFNSGHVIVEIGRVRRNSYVETFMSQLDRKRHVAMRVSSFMAAPELVSGTPLLTVTHKSLARLYAERLNLRMAELPFELPAMRQMISCHEARVDDPGVQWFKSEIFKGVGEMQGVHPA
ncbi:LysR family transcriptional regulator [Maricaulis parjimensis]|uniref:LysR family transcriptional regulator n=1 Tax=Maricaulis parjimensis TaxID=144023 RepID=UPI00193965BF